MLDALKPLIDKSIISEEVHHELQEAWNNQVDEAKENAKAELREEFARRYEHDKSQLIEALDNMVKDALTKEIKEFVDDRRKLVESQVAYKKAIKGHAKIMNEFVTRTLAKEMKEFRNDRATQAESLKKMEKFVVKALSEEIAEFGKDKKELVEMKVALISKARTKLDEVRKQFISRSAKLVETFVSDRIKKEISEFKEDITEARKNQFGREIFEAFAAEFTTGYLNEKTHTAKLHKANQVMAEQLVQTKSKLEEAKTKIKARESKIRIVEDKAKRKEVLSEMLGPLDREKKVIMTDLLDNVKTENLRESFEKYLPSVLNEQSTGRRKGVRKLNEDRRPNRRVIDGNRPKVNNHEEDETAAIIRLAGIRQ